MTIDHLPVSDLILKLYAFDILYLSYFPYRGQRVRAMEGQRN